MASTLRFDNWENSNGDVIGTAANGYLGVPGTVLQVVSTTKKDGFATTSGSFVDVTGLSASITPRSTSSKILVFASVGTMGNTDSLNDAKVRIARDGSGITGGLYGDARVYTNGTIASSPASINYLDSPSSISSLTYTVQLVASNPGTTAFINRNSANSTSFTTTLTLMEIAG